VPENQCEVEKDTIGRLSLPQQRGLRQPRKVETGHIATIKAGDPFSEADQLV
jgi:hypothetical protein